MMGCFLRVVVERINRATLTVFSTWFLRHSWIHLVEIFSKVLLSFDLVVMNKPCFRCFLFSDYSNMTIRSIFLQFFNNLLRWVSSKFCVPFDRRFIIFRRLIFLSLLQNDRLVTKRSQALVECSSISFIKWTKSFRATFANESTCHYLFFKWTTLLFGSSCINGRLLCPEPFIAFTCNLSQTSSFKSLSPAEVWLRLSATISETWFLTDRDGEKGINGGVYPECIFVLMVTMNQVPQEGFFTYAFRFLLLAIRP